MIPSQFSLLLTYFRHPEIIIAKVGGDMGLIVPPEQRLCFTDISPFGKSFSPPFIVFRDRVKLWQIGC